MPARGLHAQPRAYVPEGSWPDSELPADAPREARLALAIARRLQAAIGDRSLRTVAGISGVSASTLSNLVTGRTWGDVVTLARLEAALNVSLWGDEHLHTGESNGVDNGKVRTGRHGARSGRSDLTGTESGQSGKD